MQFIIMVILTVVCCAAANAYVNAAAEKPGKRALWLKTLASGCFVAVGAIGASGCWYTEFGYLVLGGLVCGFAGDVLLGCRYVYPKKKWTFFALGMALFALGHGLYIAALLSFTPKILYVAGPYAAAAFALSYLYLRKSSVKAGKFALPGGVYLAELCLMAGCAAGAAVYALSPGSILFAIGGLFFLMSDDLLTVNTFCKSKSSPDRYRALHILYYSAQIFFGYSLILLFVI